MPLQFLGQVSEFSTSSTQTEVSSTNRNANSLNALENYYIKSFGIKSNVSSLIYKQGIVPFICYGSQIWGSALKKKIYCRLLRKFNEEFFSELFLGIERYPTKLCLLFRAFHLLTSLLSEIMNSRLQRRTVPISV
ncbi:hypothetical protein TNCV_579131 [Trichonephila clavipes]|nr:hypothetical protein TNCV_579131 [Trichonephila clavipes]